MPLENDELGVPSTPEGSEVVSEDVKTPPTEGTVTQPKSEEKTVPYERFKKVNDELTKYKSQPKETPNANLTLEAIKVGKKLEKYSEDEIDSIAKIIKSDNPNDILAALDNDFIKQGIQSERRKVAEKNKIPAPGSSSPFGSMRKSPEEIQKMSKEEFQAYEERMVKSRKEQGI